MTKNWPIRSKNPYLWPIRAGRLLLYNPVSLVTARCLRGERERGIFILLPFLTWSVLLWTSDTSSYFYNLFLRILEILWDHMRWFIENQLLDKDNFYPSKFHFPQISCKISLRRQRRMSTCYYLASQASPAGQMYYYPPPATRCDICKNIWQTGKLSNNTFGLRVCNVVTGDTTFIENCFDENRFQNNKWFWKKFHFCM